MDLGQVATAWFHPQWNSSRNGTKATRLHYPFSHQKVLSDPPHSHVTSQKSEKVTMAKNVFTQIDKKWGNLCQKASKSAPILHSDPRFLIKTDPKKCLKSVHLRLDACKKCLKTRRFCIKLPFWQACVVNLMTLFLERLSTPIFPHFPPKSPAELSPSLSFFF